MLNKIFKKLIRNTERLGYLLKSKKINRLVVDFVLFPSDMLNIYESYHSSFGFSPRLFRPKTFNDWMQWSKVFNRRSIHVILADKVLVRRHITRIVGDSMLTTMYWHGSNLNDFDLELAPKSFVIKANNGSGTNIIVRDKESVDWDEVKRQVDIWLQNDQSKYYSEWQYRWIEPAILIEEYLEDKRSGYLIEYQFFCINGRCEFLEIDFDRHRKHSRLFLSRDFKKINLKIRLPEFDGEFEISPHAEKMLITAEALAFGHKFLRVDFYDLESPKLGELTLHPGAGMVRFEPEDWNDNLGNLLIKGPVQSLSREIAK